MSTTWLWGRAIPDGLVCAERPGASILCMQCIRVTVFAMSAGLVLFGASRVLLSRGRVLSAFSCCVPSAFLQLRSVGTSAAAAVLVLKRALSPRSAGHALPLLERAPSMRSDNALRLSMQHNRSFALSGLWWASRRGAFAPRWTPLRMPHVDICSCACAEPR